MMAFRAPRTIAFIGAAALAVLGLRSESEIRLSLRPGDRVAAAECPATQCNSWSRSITPIQRVISRSCPQTSS